MPRPVLRRYFRHGLLPQLMVFEAAARRQSVTRAAEELHLAQPTASTQIRKLSETLELGLFEQQGRGLRLTSAGRELQAACKDLFDLLERTEARLAALRNPRIDVLRLAAAPGARHLAARLLAAFCARHPGMRVSLHVAGRAGTIDRLFSGEEELCLLQPPLDRPGLSVEPAASELLRVYAPARHPLARSLSIPLESLALEPLVLREPGSSTREALLAACEARGIRPPVRAELASEEAIAEAIAAGVGLGLLPDVEATALAAAGAIVPLDVLGFPLEREWFIAHASGRPLSPAAALFLEEAGGELAAPLAFVNRSRAHAGAERELLGHD